MHRLRRARTALFIAVSFGAVAAGQANATSPNPYVTTSGTGAFTTNYDLWGLSHCALSGVNARIVNNAGSITAFTASGCGGGLRAARYSGPRTLAIDLSTLDAGVTLSAAMWQANILGGTCSFTGTLRGIGADGTGTMSLRGTLVYVPGSGTGFCNSLADIQMTLTFPGLRF